MGRRSEGTELKFEVVLLIPQYANNEIEATWGRFKGTGKGIAYAVESLVERMRAAHLAYKQLPAEQLSEPGRVEREVLAKYFVHEDAKRSGGDSD